jgi:DNA-binding NarL/FixJ family response regulator
MKVFIVDGEPVVRAGLRQTLATDPDLQIVGESSTAREAFGDLDGLQPDVVVMNLVLPGMDGAAAAREMKRRLPDVRILIFTVHARLGDLLEVLSAGATGYALRSEPLDAVCAAVRVVATGGRYVTPELAPLLARQREAPAPDVLALLSVREREVFQLIAAGSRIADVARELCISRKTVETHVCRVYRKLGCRSVGDLVRFAAGHGLLRDQPVEPRLRATA